MHTAGERVFAVFRTKCDGSIDVFGSGTYLGDKFPEEIIGYMIFSNEVCKDRDIINPCIELDSGKMVYGCECWWGNEGRMKEVLDGRVLNFVDIDDVRKLLAPSDLKCLF